MHGKYCKSIEIPYFNQTESCHEAREKASQSDFTIGRRYRFLNNILNNIWRLTLCREGHRIQGMADCKESSLIIDAAITSLREQFSSLDDLLAQHSIEHLLRRKSQIQTGAVGLITEV